MRKAVPNCVYIIQYIDITDYIMNNASSLCLINNRHVNYKTRPTFFKTEYTKKMRILFFISSCFLSSAFLIFPQPEEKLSKKADLSTLAEIHDPENLSKNEEIF